MNCAQRKILHTSIFNAISQAELSVLQPQHSIAANLPYNRLFLIILLFKMLNLL